jgi:hypothetical protein
MNAFQGSNSPWIALLIMVSTSNLAAIEKPVIGQLKEKSLHEVPEKAVRENRNSAYFVKFRQLNNLVRANNKKSE